MFVNWNEKLQKKRKIQGYVRKPCEFMDKKASKILNEQNKKESMRP